jgi:hypothetical protein
LKSVGTAIALLGNVTATTEVLMYFLFVLATSNVTTWQAALNTERTESAVSSEVALKHVARGELEYFVRANQSLNFDETVQAALRADNSAGVAQACQVRNANMDARIHAAQAKVTAGLSCEGTRECSMLAMDVRDLREACLDLAVSQWRNGGAGTLTATR